MNEQFCVEPSRGLTGRGYSCHRAEEEGKMDNEWCGAGGGETETWQQGAAPRSARNGNT